MRVERERHVHVRHPQLHRVVEGGEAERAGGDDLRQWRHLHRRVRGRPQERRGGHGLDGGRQEVLRELRQGESFTMNFRYCD